MASVKITATTDGPYKVEGDVEVVDPTGADATEDRSALYLCRCGESDNKPYCDGTHSKIDFDASEAYGG